MERCDTLFVLDIEGWQQSKGIKIEVEYALANGKEVKMVTPRGKVYKYAKEQQ
jgi:hypothetical protein